MTIHELKDLLVQLNKFIAYNSELAVKAREGKRFSRDCIAPRFVDTVVISKKCAQEVSWMIEGKEIQERIRS